MTTATFLRRRRRLLFWLAGLFATFSLLGFFVAPIVLKQQLVKHASAALHRPVAVETVRVNPWTWSVTIRSLVVTAHDGAEFAGWDELYVNFSPWASLGRRAWSLDEIRLVHPRARLYRETDGTLNIADLLPPPAAPAPAPDSSAPIPGIVVDRLTLERGEFTYADKSRSAPFSTTFGPTSFELVDFTTRPNRAGAYTFAAATEAGERFAWRGSLTFAPLGSAGHVELADLRLPKYAAFHRDLHQLDLLDGRLGVELDYTLDLAGAEPVARLANGRIALADLKVAARGSTAPLATIPLVELSGLAADSAARTARLDALLVRGADLSVTRRADGSIDWLALLQPAVPAAPPAPTPAPITSHPAPITQNPSPSPAFSATLSTFALEGATLRLHDLTNPRPVDLTLDQISAKLEGIDSSLERAITVAAGLRWNSTGSITLAGTVRPRPLAATLDLAVADLALRPLDPYLAPFLNVLVTSGAVRAKGRIVVDTAADGTPALRWQGDAGLANFATVDGEFSEPLAGFADLAFNGIQATTHPLAVSLEEIALKDPYARVVVLADKRLNLTTALKQPAPAPAATAAPATAPEKPAVPPVTIARVTLAGARLAFTDRSTTPAFATELTDFGGTIAGLSSEQLARAEVDLSGRLGLAPLRVTGQINPLSGDAFTDVKVAFTGIELPPFTPYSGKFAGYTIERGKLSLDLAYHLSARELVAENKVAFDQFYFGETVDSPDAVKLPLKLALAILRDRDGRIPIDLPIRGNLDDPDFKYGKLVWQALGNLVVKAATAPFSLLGGLFGGGHDLSAVDFASGSAVFTPEATARLDGLAKALAERPALRLGISSLPQPELDLAGLRETQLDSLLRARRLRELAATTTENLDPAALTLTPDDTARLLAALAAERCPPETLSPGTEQPAPSGIATPTAPPAKPKGNLVVRTFRRLFVEPTPAEQPAATAGVRSGQASAAAGTAPAGPTPEELRAKVLATIDPTAEDYAALAARRAQAIQEYLVTTGRIDAARVFLAPASLPPAGAPAPRVVFELQ